jgi:hypothetical protein
MKATTITLIIVVAPLAGQMAVSGGRRVIWGPQAEACVNFEADLDTGDEPLYCCTVQAATGQTIAVVQASPEGLVWQEIRRNV